MEEEMLTLEQNITWDIIHLPLGKSSFDGQWVCIVKVKHDGSFVVEGKINCQRIYSNIWYDYLETFLCPRKNYFVLLLIALAVSHDWRFIYWK